MLIQSLLVFSALLCLANPGSRDDRAATEWDGPLHFVEYIPGDAPLVLSAPHGGGLKPRDIANRTYGKTVRDSYTLEIGRAICDEIHRLTGRRPHFIACHLHRSKLDANREIKEAAQGNDAAEAAWKAYHEFIERARKQVAKEHRQGLYVDLHGQSHAEDWVEWGYTIPVELLLLADHELDAEDFTGKPSIRALAKRSDRTLAELVRGKHSLGALLSKLGYECVPSPRHPRAKKGSYYSGGYSTQRHGSRKGGTIDGVQLELPRGVRKTRDRRDAIAKDVAAVLVDFIGEHYGADWIESE